MPDYPTEWGWLMCDVQSVDQAKAYKALSAALIDEGYEDLLTGEPDGVRDALRQMAIDADEMQDRVYALKELLAKADQGQV
ncbi:MULTISPECIES: hypothetical protein [Pseudomonas syringae group]|uniref:hypothetical protein n=1 Tax=Pseudomonas syringae group TaxID=136849 RepID=UPI000B314B03|nr:MULTISPECIES: hypothetical protein [Pseudomonas syringae group]NAP32506.1 hypothetical protein [Pseudomonas syringae]